MMQKTIQRTANVSGRRNFSAAALKQRMESVIADRQKEVIAFRKEHADTVIGEILPGHLVRNAPAEEIAFMESWNVWEKVPVSQCWHRTGKKPIRFPLNKYLVLNDKQN